MAFHVLLYRYFFFSWLFKDVNKGNVYERHAAWKHNKTQSHWLFTYLRRWVVLTISFYLLGGLFEVLLELPVVSAFFYVPSAITIAINSVIGIMIAAFKIVP